MFNDLNLYIFTLCLLFAALLLIFNGFIDRPVYVDIFVLLLMAVPVAGFVYVLKFPNANVTPFYVLFSALLVAYIVAFAFSKVYVLFAH